MKRFMKISFTACAFHCSKKKPQTVEKPTGYAAKFAVRKSLLSKQPISQPCSQESPQNTQYETSQTQANYSNLAISYPPGQAGQPSMYSYSGGAYPITYPYMGLTNQIVGPSGVQQPMHGM